MPVDGTGTDEQLTEPVKPLRDFETHLMAGCMTIGVISLVVYFLTIWPFTVLPEYTRPGLTTILLTGALPATILGIIASRKFALAGAIGYFGGAMAAAVFMHLRLQQTMLGNFTKDLPLPEYPEQVAVGLPIVWFFAAGAVAWFFCRREPESP